MENAQILENKWTCLQALIDMFEHQSNTFLLNHQPTNNVSMSPLRDYSEYDNIDDMDEFRKLEQSDEPGRIVLMQMLQMNLESMPRISLSPFHHPLGENGALTKA